jgi:putative ABC transport system permease protein
LVGVVHRPAKRSFFYEEKKFEPETIYADSLFFRTMGLEIVRGDDRLLGVRDNLFLSETMAQIIFGWEEPIGKMLVFGKRYTYVNMKTQFQRPADWVSNDDYYGYVRLLSGTNPVNSLKSE